MKLFYTGVFGMLLTYLTINVQAQPQSPNLTPELGSVLLPSPAAASLGRYLEQPVSLHTGLPTTSLPIWQLKRGDLSVEVGLSYHGGGLKVDEPASWVGIGWTLQGAGMVTRTVRGLPDDVGAFNLTQLNRYFTHVMGRTEEQNFLYNVWTGVVDAEPDLYSVTAPGISCQFYLGSNGQYVTIPREANLRIENYVWGGPSKNYVWFITDGRGVQYKFWAADNATTTYTAPGNAGFPTSEYTGDSSWMLDEMEDTQGNRMQFAYVSEGTVFSTIASERFSYSTTRSNDCTGNTAASYMWSVTQGQAQRLASITCGPEQVRFVPHTAERADAHGSHALERVEIRYQAQLKRRFQFFTSSWGANPIGTAGTYYPDVQNQSRLRLDSLREESGDGALTKPATRFIYEAGELPYRGSAAQDHWGYANGQDNRMRVSYVMGGQKAGARKEPNPTFSKAGLLTGIRHPTGGTTEFVYEPNRYTQYTSQVPYDSTLVFGILATTPTGYLFSADFTFEIDASLGGPAGPLVRMKIDKQAYINGVLQGATQAGYTWEASLFRANGTPLPSPPALGGVNLPPGSYRLHLAVEKEFEDDPDMPRTTFVQLQVSLISELTRLPTPIGYYGPGLRIRQIIQRASGQSPLTRTYEYLDPATGQSSGQLGGLPDYHTSITYHYVNHLSPDASYRYTCACQEYTSTSKYPLVSTQGSYMGYSYVTEYTSQDKTQGRRTYQFTNYDVFNDINNQTAFPHEPASPRGYLRGLPLGTQTWAATPSGSTDFTLQQADSLGYDYLPNSVTRAYGLKVGMPDRFVESGAGMWPDFPIDINTMSSILTISQYPLESSSYQVVAKASVQHDGACAFHQRSSYAYAPDLFQISRISSRTSAGDQQVQRVYYPTDYPAASPLVTALRNAHRLTVPLETSRLLLPAGSSPTRPARLTGGVVHQYAVAPSNPDHLQFYLSRVYSANTVLADTSQHFAGGNVPTFYEEKARVTQVTAHGLPRTQVVNRQVVTATLWDAAERYPLAQCANARADEVFHENFESYPAASVAAAYSGQYGLAGTYTVQWTVPNARPYYLRYRYRVGNAWRVRRLPYPGPGTALTGGDAYDDVCIYPQDAQLTTYTYEPLVGETSVTGPDGRTIFYEYDGLGRLVRTRDEQGRILGQQQYHYAGQP